MSDTTCPGRGTERVVRPLPGPIERLAKDPVRHGTDNRGRVRLDQNSCKTLVVWTDEWIGRRSDYEKTKKAGVEGLDDYLENRVHSRVALTHVQVWRVRKTGVGRTGGQRTRVHETAINKQTCLGSA